MKKFLLLSMLALVCGIYSFGQTITFKTVNPTGSTYDSYTTTDSTIAAKKTITVSDSTVGILEVTVIGFSDSLAVGVTGSQIVRFKKVNGTLTLGTPEDLLAKATDTGLGTATWDISTSSNNIVVRLKGKLNVSVKWKIIVTRRSFNKVT
jgi:hypothetical protein